MLRLSGYLDRLEQEARHALPPDEARALVFEARDHLEHSIQARLELGATPEEAEAEAIAAFGTAQAVGDEAKWREPRIDRRFLLSCLVVLLFWGWVGTIQSLPDWMAIPFVLIAGAVHVAFVVASLYARRIQAIALGAILVPLWLGWSTKQAADHVYANLRGGLYRTDRLRLADEIRSQRAWADQIGSEAETLLAGHEAFLKNGSTLSPSRSVSYTEDGKLRLFRRASRTEAEAYWDEAAGAAARRSHERSAANLRRRAQVLEDAGNAPWWPHVPSEMVFTITGEVGAIFTTYGALHLAGWFAGWALRRRKGRNGTLVSS